MPLAKQEEQISQEERRQGVGDGEVSPGGGQWLEMLGRAAGTIRLCEVEKHH